MIMLMRWCAFRGNVCFLHSLCLPLSLPSPLDILSLCIRLAEELPMLIRCKGDPMMRRDCPKVNGAVGLCFWRRGRLLSHGSPSQPVHQVRWSPRTPSWWRLSQFPWQWDALCPSSRHPRGRMSSRWRWMTGVRKVGVFLPFLFQVGCWCRFLMFLTRRFVFELIHYPSLL